MFLTEKPVLTTCYHRSDEFLNALS